jgi:hypothetical protein
LALGIVFIVLFSLLTIAHLALTIKSRVWWLLFLVVGGICQIVGWSGRLASAINVYSLNAFLLQQILLVLGPVFFSAVCYALLGSMVRPRKVIAEGEPTDIADHSTQVIAIGRQYSVLPPAWYTIIFVIVDVISIAIQASGGGLAASSLADDKESVMRTLFRLRAII